jgi:thiamine biosynthesis lipoprotein
MASRDLAATRREFLGARGLGALAAALGLDLGGDIEAPACGELLVVCRAAMACRFEILLPDSSLAAAAGEALALVDDLEQQLSVFKPDSELSAINRSACERPVEVEHGLFALLETCARLWAETSGSFDAAQGALSALWRCCRKEGRAPRPEEIEAAVSQGGMQHVILDPPRKTVAFTRPGVALNLGAIGKGYAVDRICHHLRAGGVRNALAHAGHSSIFAMGGPAPGQPWLVSVENPQSPDEPIAKIALRDQAMATSAATHQAYEVDGHRYGHIIDPRIGRPAGWRADKVLSATAIASTATEADALSTAFHIMGLEQAAAYCERNPGVGALIVRRDEESGNLQVTNFGIPPGALEVLV